MNPSPPPIGSPEETALLRSLLGLAEGEEPFPWQKRLLGMFRRGLEDIPTSLDLPTGLGKTSTMAIWLLARALGAPLPRRLVYVVDRRAVVDQATAEALRLRERVAARPGPYDLGAALGLRRIVPGDRSQGRTGVPLPVSTLRGRLADNRLWMEDPAMPAIVVGTVDMIGSRLLFQGYGVSRKLRPYVAGLLGVDTLFIVDESHLVPPFEDLLRSVASPSDQPHPATRRIHARCGDLPPMWVLSLSATQSHSDEDSDASKVFTLDADDEADPAVRRRLLAVKRLTVHARLPWGDYAKAAILAEELSSLALRCAYESTSSTGPERRILVYAHSHEAAVKTVELLRKELKKRKKEGVVRAFLGGQRINERERLADALASLGFLTARPSGDRPESQSASHLGPRFLVATSAGEVGVDLDSDTMVCDLVSWERMVQRLGRVNRRGEQESDVYVVAPRRQDLDTPGKVKPPKAYGFPRERYGAWLKAIATLPPSPGGWMDASPAALVRASSASDSPAHEATTPKPTHPPLLPEVLDSWAMTSIGELPTRPIVEPWLRGWVEDQPDTVVVWRYYLPIRKNEDGAFVEVDKDEIGAFFEAAPIHLLETLEAPTQRVYKWLETCAKRMATTADDASVPEDERWPKEDEPIGFVLDRDGSCRRVLTWQELSDQEKRKKVKHDIANRTLIVHARVHGLDPEGYLQLSAKRGQPKKAPPAPPIPYVRDFRRDPGEGEDASSQDFPEDLRLSFAVRDAAQMQGTTGFYAFATEVSGEGEPRCFLVLEDEPLSPSRGEDTKAISRAEQTLEEHLRWTRDCASDIVERLGASLNHGGWPEAVVRAAEWHDRGKALERWQRAFHAPRDGHGPYAKTKGPLDLSILEGYRHELGSLYAFIRRHAETSASADLTAHLIASHHGWARPTISIRGWDEVPPSLARRVAYEVGRRFAEQQRSWGVWGLAWLEAVVRASDQIASRALEQRTSFPEPPVPANER